VKRRADSSPATGTNLATRWLIAARCERLPRHFFQPATTIFCGALFPDRKFFQSKPARRAVASGRAKGGVNLCFAGYFAGLC
jgi:hypothetical protein